MQKASMKKMKIYFFFLFNLMNEVIETMRSLLIAPNRRPGKLLIILENFLYLSGFMVIFAVHY